MIATNGTITITSEIKDVSWSIYSHCINNLLHLMFNIYTLSSSYYYYYYYYYYNYNYYYY